MKLFTDEESEYMCRDSRPVPMELRQEVFDMLINDNHISKFNPMKKKGKGGGDDKGDDPMNPFKKSYHIPANINIYCNAVCQRDGLNPVAFLKEYNEVYDKLVKKDIPIPYNTEKLTERYSNNAMDNAMDNEERDMGTEPMERDMETDRMERDMGTDPMEFRDIPRGRPATGMIYNFITGEYEPRQGEVVIVNQDPDDMEMNRMRDALGDL